MLKVKAQQLNIYFPLLFVSIGIVVIALGPGLFGQKSVTGFSWQHQVFAWLCHQDPIRSFSINNQTMAVCTRCLGIYISFAFVVLLMPLISRFFYVINKKILKLILVIIVVNFLDVLLNALDIWTNTLLSRLLLGILFGGFLALLLTNEFFKQINKMEKSYGK